MFQNTENKKYILHIAIAVIALAVIFIGMLQSGGEGSLNEEVTNTEIFSNPFVSLSLAARSAYVFDIKDGVPLYALNEEIQLPLASLAKLMAAFVASEFLPEEGVITINKESVEQEGDIGLRVGEKLTLQNLIDLTLVSSSNDGAHALASALSFGEDMSPPWLETIFLDQMNIKAREIGMDQTYFVNESGLDTRKESLSGAYGSSRDIALLLGNILKKHPTLLVATRYSSQNVVSLNGFTHTVSNTNQSISSFPGVIASKTGFTDLAGGNLAVVFEAGPMRPIAVVVLGSTQEGRFEDVRKLIEATLKYFYMQ